MTAEHRHVTVEAEDLDHAAKNIRGATESVLDALATIGTKGSDSIDLVQALMHLRRASLALAHAGFEANDARDVDDDRESEAAE